MIGQTISHYKILEKLGEGGMGVVYKAEDTKLKRTVALKFLSSQALGTKEEKIRFVHEAQAAAALNHTNICTVHEIDEREGQSFIAMEYVEGESLKSRVEPGPLKLAEAIGIITQAAEGLKRAHEKGIVHRDIKTANIMVTGEGQAKIMDFGLAKSAEMTKLTRTGTTVGTLAYMSPEQTRGEEVDHRGDIWSLGVVLYELLTGKTPFKGDHEAAMVYSIMNQDVEPPSDLTPEVSAELDSIVAKMLQKKPDDRYTDLTALLSDLQKVQTGATLKVTLPRSRRVKRMTLGLSVVFVIAAVTTSVVMLNRGPSPVIAKTLAVVEFDIISGEEADHLAVGLSEGISVKLSKLGSVRVVSSDDIRRLRKKDLSAKEVATQLGAQFALGGSLFKSGEQVRVTPQLIDASSGDVIWSELFDREFSDVFGFLDEISLKIVAALKVELDPSEKIALEEKPTENAKAYEHYLKGRHFYYRTTARDNELAEKEFKKALLIDSEYPLAMAGLADAYVQRYKERYDYDEHWLDESARLIENALELEPALAEAYESKAEVLIEKEDYMSALAAARKARSLRPDWDEPYLRLGEIHQLRGEGSRALDMFGRALEIRPSVEGLCGKGEVYRKQGSTDSAKVAFQHAAELNPEHDRPLYDLASVYYDLEDQDETERLFRRAIEVRPDRGRSYDELVSIMYWEHGDIEGAEKLLRGFVDRYPYHQEAYELLYGLMAWYKGDFPAALAVIDEAMTHNPDRVWPHLLLAEAHTYRFDEQASREAALAALGKALEMRPNSSRVLSYAGDLYGTLGDTGKALDYYRLALEMSPGSPSIRAELAMTLMNRARFDSAEVVAAEAVKQTPGRLELWRRDPYEMLNDALTFQMRAEEYLGILRDSADKYGRDDPFFYVSLGMNQCLSGQYQEAMESFNHVRDIQTERSSARTQVTLRNLRWLGMAQWFSGDTDAALRTFRKSNETEDQWDRLQSGQRLISLLMYLDRFDDVEQLIDGLHEEGMMTAWVRHAHHYYFRMRYFEKVVRVIDEALESQEITWKTDLKLEQAKAYRRAGDLEKAEELLRAIDVQVRVRDPEYELMWAAIEATKGRLERALRFAETAYETRISEYERNIYLPLLSRLYYALDRKQDALDMLAGANHRNFYVECFYQRAQMAAATGSPDAVAKLRMAQFLADRAARGGYIWWSLGIARIYGALAAARLGDPQRARTEIEYAVKLEPELAEVAYLAAAAYALTGDTQAALDWLQTAIERGHQELWWARVDPDLAPLRELPRFKEIMDEWERQIEALIN